MQIPTSVLNAATGIPESTFNEFKKYPLVIAPGTGGEACMAKCDIDFQTVSRVACPQAPFVTPQLSVPSPLLSMLSIPLARQLCGALCAAIQQR